MTQRNFQEEHVVDIDVLVLSTTCPSSDDIHKNKETYPVIHEIKNQFRNKENDVYKPKSLSIGPYRYGSPDLQEMQKVKYIYLDYILNLNPEKKLADYLSALKELEEQVKCAYANEIKMDRNNFLKLLLLDGCFILVALHGIGGIILSRPEHNMLDANPDEVNADVKVKAIEEYYPRDKITQNSTNHELSEQENSNQEYLCDDTIVHDILLVENQIPFCVVKVIFEVFTGRIDATSLLTKNIVESIANMVRSYSKQTREDRQPREFYHLLHLCHMLFKPNYLFISNQNEIQSHIFPHFLKSDTKFLSSRNKMMPHYLESKKSTTSQHVPLWRPTTQYHTAKIEFKKREIYSDNPHSLLDIEFCNSIMEIPCLSIEPRTYRLLRNLVAFEQACPQFGNYITSYVLFWSRLIIMPDDASLLIEKGIIINHLQSDKEVTNLLSALAKDVTFDFNGDYYLKPLCYMVEAHYQHQRSKWRGLFGTVNSNIHSWVSQNKPKLPKKAIY